MTPRPKVELEVDPEKPVDIFKTNVFGFSVRRIHRTLACWWKWLHKYTGPETRIDLLKYPATEDTAFNYINST